MTPYLPPAGTANGTAVVIFPGGGYQHLSMEKEGSDIANWLAGVFVLLNLIALLAYCNAMNEMFTDPSR